MGNKWKLCLPTWGLSPFCSLHMAERSAVVLSRRVFFQVFSTEVLLVFRAGETDISDCIN
jgi:hypothetical protein